MSISLQNGIIFSVTFVIQIHMKQILLLITIAFSGLMSYAQHDTTHGKELIWQTWNDGFSAAQQSNKIALIDVYTDWCGWCKVMDKNTYTNPKVVEAINANFVPIKFNPEKPEKYFVGKDTIDGRSLLGALSGGKSSGYPTTYFFIPGSNQIFQQPGYIEPDQFLLLLENVASRSKN